MNTTTRKPFVSSARLGAKLSTSSCAQAGRLDAALKKVGLPFGAARPFFVGKGLRASVTVATLRNGVEILVSYETAVAFRLPGSIDVTAVSLGHYSRTTDRSIRDFANGGPLAECAPEAFLEAVKAATL